MTNPRVNGLCKLEISGRRLCVLCDSGFTKTKVLVMQKYVPEKQIRNRSRQLLLCRVII